MVGGETGAHLNSITLSPIMPAPPGPIRVRCTIDGSGIMNFTTKEGMMARAIHVFRSPDRFVAGTVGQPGDRTFFLQAVHQARSSA